MDGENRRSHKLAPFVRQNPVSMSEMAIFQQSQGLDRSDTNGDQFFTERAIPSARSKHGSLARRRSL